MTTSPDPVDVFAGAQVRARRKELHISQERLAELSGITFQQVQKYERAANRISVSRLARIATALDVPPGYFFPASDAALPADVDPIERRAQELYEIGRRRVSGRPRWADLNRADAYDMAMIDQAMAMARAEVAES